MRVIRLNIPLEQFKSRTPGLIPSFPLFDKTEGVDKLGEDGRIHGQTITFTEENILTDYQNANYGMCPSDVKYIKDGRVFSYGDITSIRSFFREYYGLLTRECCGNRRNYKNAMELYTYEGSIDGMNVEYFAELDRKAKKYGANTETGEICELYKDIEDGLYRSVEIPSEFVEAWDRKTLCITEVIDWRNWFNNNRYSCSGDTIDCCLCQKYEELGGDNMLEWLNSIDIDTNLGNFESLDSAWVRITFPLATKLHELGEMDEMIEEWVPGMDYTPDEIYALTKDGFGTICYHNGEPYGIRFGQKGYEYNQKRHEIVWAPEQWYKYGDDNNITDEPFTPFYDYYAYKGNHIYVHPVKEEDLVKVPADRLLTPENMVDKYDIRRGEFFRVNNLVKEVVESDYIIYNTKSNSPYNGKPVLVSYNGTIPYVRINNRVYYAYKPIGSDEYVFNFGSKRCGKKINEDCPIIKDGKFVVIGELAYKVENGKVKVGNNTYIMFDGVCEYGDGTLLVNGSSLINLSWTYNNSGKQVMTESNELGEKNPFPINSDTSGYEIHDDKLIVYEPYTIYHADMVTGEVDSKLAHLQDKQKSYDDYGNILPGKYHIANSIFSAPTDGYILDLYYHKGNVSNLEFIRENKEGNTTTKYFYGDIITEIEFYYKYNNGDIVIGTVTNVDDEESSDNRPYINECAKKKEDILSGDVENEDKNSIYTINDNMYCRITYRVGCILSATSTEDEEGYVVNRDYYKIDLANAGILYQDEITMSDGTCIYKFGGGDPYTLRYYQLTEETMVATDEYGNEYTVPKSTMTLVTPDGNIKKGYDVDVDYLIIQFIWTRRGGKDLDIRTGLQDDPSTDVGFYGGQHNESKYFLWAADNTGTDKEGITCIEAVVVKIKDFYNDYSDEIPCIISNYGHWYARYGDGDPATPNDGDVVMNMEVYHGGEPDIIPNQYYYIKGGVLLDRFTETINVSKVSTNSGREYFDNMTTITYNNESRMFSFTKNDGHQIDYNNCHTVPVFRKPWKQSLNLGQNTKIDIYINRGKNQSHDKHLKLMEVRSIEAMEQYGNSFWDINNNT